MDFPFYVDNRYPTGPSRQEVAARITEEFRRNREEATKKYEEEMAGYSISSHDIPPANENKPLVFSISDLSSPDRCILDVSTKVFHTISSPHLRDALCLYNKGGWLLMCHEEQVCSKQYQNSSLFLLNPRSGSRIDLPGPFEKGNFALSLTCGNPSHVIHASFKIPTRSVVIRVIRPNDSAWEVHELDKSHRGLSIIISSVLVIGNRVMCIDSKGARIIMLDLSNGSWTFLSNRKKFPTHSKCYFFEQDNEVMCVSCPAVSCDFFKFYKLDLQMMDWVEINNVELMNTSWFLSNPCSFCVKGGKGKYVYSLDSVFCWGGQPGERARPTCETILLFRTESEVPVNVFIHNMVEGDLELLLPEKYGSKKPPCWVDRRILY